VQERYGEAEGLYRKAVGLQPALPKPHALLGNRLVQGGLHEEGLSHLEQAIRLGERTEGVFHGRVEALLGLGRVADALTAARQAAAAFPASVVSFDLLSRAADAAGSAEEAASARIRMEEIRRLQESRTNEETP
jgi:tetratricopeptide (TPR) repeat protein